MSAVVDTSRYIFAAPVTGYSGPRPLVPIRKQTDFLAARVEYSVLCTEYNAYISYVSSFPTLAVILLQSHDAVRKRK